MANLRDSIGKAKLEAYIAAKKKTQDDGKKATDKKAAK